MNILNRSKQPVQVEILTKDEESSYKTSNQLKNDLISNKIKNSINSVDLNKPNKVDKQVQTDSKWLEDLIYEHTLKYQIKSNDQTKLNSLNKKELFNKDSDDSDDFYEVLDDLDLYIDDENSIDENCDAFEYKVS